MKHQGVHYDTVRREMQIIRDDLHANAVRVVGSDLRRLTEVARVALELGLVVWFSPAFFEYPPEETTSRLLSAATAAGSLEAAHRGQVVFVAGSEHTLFTRGLLPGRSVVARVQRLKAEPALLRTVKLNEFLGSLVPKLRAAFSGPLTYGSLSFEQVDWETFDYVGVDHYRDDRIKDRYVEMLEPFMATGKPVIVTEFGMRTYRGAESSARWGSG